MTYVQLASVLAITVAKYVPIVDNAAQIGCFQGPVQYWLLMVSWEPLSVISRAAKACLL
jgi:hypothetical protein